LLDIQDQYTDASLTIKFYGSEKMDNDDMGCKMDVSKNSINYWEWLSSGKQWDFINQHNNNNIWSLIVTDLDDSNDTLWEIASGMHYVNVQGYLVTEVPYSEDISIVY